LCSRHKINRTKFLTDSGEAIACYTCFEPFGTLALRYSDCWFFHGLQVLVVQASEAPNDLRSTAQANPVGENTHDATKRNASESSAFSSTKAAPEGTYKAREIVAYDDLF
jgi:hypothetical protein